MSRPHTPAFQLRRPNLPQGNPNGSSGLGPGGRSTPTLGRATISLEEWERQAPLSDEQQGVVREVSGRLEQRELPEKFRNNAQAGPSRPSTPPTHTPKPRRIAHLQHPSPSPSRARTPVTAPGSPNPGNAANGLFSSQMLGGHRMDPLHPDLITTPQEFQDHFSALTLSTEHEQDSLYRDHLGEITGLRDKCDELVELLGSASGEVGDMLKALEYVEERSESLRGACEDLLEEQTHLLTHTSQLAHRLTFFTFLESSQRLLNTPSSTLVLSPDFLPMLQRLDECIGYLEQHRDFKDAELYLMRYQQCLTRSMTLIKIYFVNTIRTTGQEVARKLSETALSETAIQALVFPKFASLAQTCRPLLAQLEDRVSRNSGELAQFLTECHSAWIGARAGIIAPRVAEEVRRLDPSVGDVIDLTRAGCSYLKQACTDEFELYKMFFLSGEPQLYGFLESLCDNLYDHLRPRILHEPNLEVLCGVCTVLQALMVQDVSDYQEPDDQVFYSEDASPRSPYAYTPRGGTPTGNNPNGGQDDYFGSAAMGYSHTNPAPQNQYQNKSGYSSTARSPVFGKRSLSHMSLSYHRNSSYGHSSSRQSHSYGQHSPYDSASQLTRKGHGQYGYATHHNSQSQQHRPRRPLSRLHTEMLLSMVLQDAQTRLVFRAQAMLAADVQYYVPKEGDLDYPAKLALGSKTLVPKPSHPPNSISLDGDEDEDPVFLALPPPESQEGWYPTLRMTLWILSCLWTYVDQGVFEDLAQEAIGTCRQSLTAASQTLMAQKDKDMDARLFLVRHLLILKEMTAGLDLGARSGRRDWGGVTDFLRSLLENASYMLGYGKGSNKPGVVTDAKTDIDRELKRVCEDLIRLGAEAASAPLRDFLNKCTAHLASRPPASTGAVSGQASDLANQPFATPEKVKEAHDAFKAQAKGEFEQWCTKTRGYLMDEETVGVLVPPAQSAIVDAYRHFHDLVRAEYDFATAASLMTPSAVATLLAS